MSDPVMDAYTNAYNASGQMVQAFGVVKADGSVLWQSNNWDLTADALALVSAASKGAASVTQNQVKYSTIRTSPESLVARNVTGSGLLVLAKIEGDKWVVAWAAAEAAPDGIYVDVDRAAKSLKGRI
jgi:predicted regulator of Ras-like GTPase activity (Roadblock/LC7/MglB family)